MDLAGYDSYAAALARGGVLPFLSDEELAARTYLDRMVARVAARGLVASGEVRHGVAAREIVTLARAGDLIVMATHGRGGMARWFLGSVAEEVVRHAPVPLLLVRGEHDDHDEREGQVGPALGTNLRPRKQETGR
jgi:nucleotide-binding universal stress UspA family protein